MYSYDSRIRYSEVGSDSKLTLLSLLDYFQDGSIFQSEELGLGVEYLREQKMGWVLNFWQIDIDRYADLCERVTINTHPYDFKMYMGFRNFQMLGADGKQIAVANTLWTLLDMENNRPVKPPRVMLDKYKISPPCEMEYLPRKITFEGKEEACPRVEVRKHHLDTNYHVNNGQYVAVACDFLPQDFKVDRLRAVYHKAAVLGDVFYPVLYHINEKCIGVALNDEQGTAYANVEFTCRQ